MAYVRAEQEAVAAVVRPSPGNLLSAKQNRFCPSDHRYHYERSVPPDGITAAIKAAAKSLRRNGHQLHQTRPQTKYALTLQQQDTYMCTVRHKRSRLTFVCNFVKNQRILMPCI